MSRLTVLFVGSTTTRPSDEATQPPQEFSGLAELTISDINYNTASHDGLRSEQALSDSSHTIKPTNLRITRQM
jgi:hypothetical protein